MSSKLIKIQIEKTHLIFKRVSTKPKARRERKKRSTRAQPLRCRVHILDHREKDIVTLSTLS
jgi:hypothetical protein